MPLPRVIFMGSPGFAVPSLTALAERPDLCEMVAVVTQPDKPAGRGRKLTPSAINTAAQARGLPVLQPTKMKTAETRDAIAAFEPDICVVAAYGRILPPALLELPRLGCINVHASLLPRHRGASPIAHAIMADDAETGVCIMKMDEGLDTGPVFSRRSIPIGPRATLGELTVSLAEVGASLLIDSWPGIVDGSLTPEAQPDEGSTYAPLLKKIDGFLSFTEDAHTLARRVRGLHPWPGAFALRGSDRVQIFEALPEEGSGEPGEVIAAGKNGVTVACREGALRLCRVKPAGKKAMDASSWVAGRGVAVGDHFSIEAK